MNRLFYKLLLFGSLLPGTRCISQTTYHTSKSNADVKRYHLSDTLLREWRKDKSGCLSLRCKYLRPLQDNKLLIGMPKSTFIKLFGKPNNEGEDVLTYNLCMDCDPHKKIKKDTERNTWIVFSFKDNKLQELILSLQ